MLSATIKILNLCNLRYLRMLFFGRNKAPSPGSKLTNPPRRKAFDMLQLFELIAGSPLGAFFVSILRDTFYAAMILSDCDECGFNDLGKLLFGGLVLAVVIGVAASLYWRRRKENDSRSDFVSIRADDRR